jgi:uncharacterized protein YndB with AHSA1/START domain
MNTRRSAWLRRAVCGRRTATVPDILHRLPVHAPAARVFEMFALPAGLNAWWTLTAAGTPTPGTTYHFDFGPGYAWESVVTACDPARWIEWQMTVADADWTDTRVGVRLTPSGDRTTLDFYHAGWRHANEHYRSTSCCWAAYLRILRRYLEHGEHVPYADRLDA